MEKQISIIIPTYNMEEYIGNCIDSLIIPSFDDVEVIVVNDGSKDRSSEIAHSYSMRYPNSIRVVDKPNGNYGSCINAALPLCKGRYIKILDADDTFNTEDFAVLVFQLKSCKEDVVITKFQVVSPEGNTTGFSKFTIDTPLNEPLKIDDNTARFIPEFIGMYEVAYNRELFQRFDYKQTEGISYTDTQWALLPLSHCTSMHFLNLYVYRYLVGREGQTMDKVVMQKNFKNFITILRSLIDKYNDVNLSDISKKLLLKHICRRHVFVYYMVVGKSTNVNMNILREYDTYLLSQAQEVYKFLDNYTYGATSYKVFNDLRRKKYPTNFHLSFIRCRIPLFFQRLRGLITLQKS